MKLKTVFLALSLMVLASCFKSGKKKLKYEIPDYVENDYINEITRKEIEIGRLKKEIKRKDSVINSLIFTVR